MKLKEIVITNFRSIEKVEIPLNEIEGSYTYSLLGINESGKSSLLKAISLVDDDSIKFPTDYFDKTKPVEIKLSYSLTIEDIEETKAKIQRAPYKLPLELANQLEATEVSIIVSFPPKTNPQREVHEQLNLSKDFIEDYFIDISTFDIYPEKEEDNIEFSFSSFFKKAERFFYSISHYTVLWQSTPEYLLLDEIDLATFAKEPEKTSIPLLNTFYLAGIEKSGITSEIASLNTPVSIKSLESKLSDAITEYINKVWPEHPISLSFLINNNKITLLVEDHGVKHSPKTTEQRSEGFKQFISFLLTISAENSTGNLSKTILLIDEPETHLHPPAQLNLLNELIKISQREDNICFFATHSNYMIDKQNLDRSIKVIKEKNSKTKITQIEKKFSSYAEVNYEVFNIPTTDYHNELYGYIEMEDKTLLEGLDKNKKWIDSRSGKEKTVSLCEYIRHSIHHPENTLNKKFSDKELLDSIKKLRSLRDSIM